MIALGADLDRAMWLAVELETIARQYYLSLALGDPFILTEEQIAETTRAFSTYGLQDLPETLETGTRGSRAKRPARRPRAQSAGAVRRRGAGS